MVKVSWVSTCRESERMAVSGERMQWPFRGATEEGGLKVKNSPDNRHSPYRELGRKTG
jgi:hypothetical protein